VWKEFGYSAVIFLAALTGINPSLYEAAGIDGSNRWQSTIHITLPALSRTVLGTGISLVVSLMTAYARTSRLFWLGHDVRTSHR
jgi:putative aldouronate transport system permease protein